MGAADSEAEAGERANTQKLRCPTPCPGHNGANILQEYIAAWQQARPCTHRPRRLGGSHRERPVSRRSLCPKRPPSKSMLVPFQPRRSHHICSARHHIGAAAFATHPDAFARRIRQGSRAPPPRLRLRRPQVEVVDDGRRAGLRVPGAAVPRPAVLVQTYIDPHS